MNISYKIANGMLILIIK